jgi:ATP-binding cassette subfamily B multidrug efflux pump
LKNIGQPYIFAHAELLQQRGIYAQLWAHQTCGFIGEQNISVAANDLNQNI